MLTLYQSDGWGATLKSQAVVSGSGERVLRKARWRHEFLLHRFVFTLMHSGGIRKGMRFSPPLSLRNGATAFHVYEAYNAHAMLARKAGHQGILIDAHCFEGCLSSALRRHISASARLYYVEPCVTKPESDDPMLDLMHWLFFHKVLAPQLEQCSIQGFGPGNAFGPRRRLSFSVESGLSGRW